MADPNQRPDDYGTLDNLPTVEQAFPTPQQQDAQQANHSVANVIGDIGTTLGLPGLGAIYQTATRDPAQGSFYDYLFTHTAYGRVLGAMGQTAKDGFSNSGDLIPQELQDKLRSSGMWNDYVNNKTSLLKTINETWMRPAILSANLVQKTFGGVAGGIEGGLAQLGAEADTSIRQDLGEGVADTLNLKGLGHTAAEMTEWATSTGAMDVAGFHASQEQVRQQVWEARANGVIGETEGTFMGTREPTAAQQKGRDEATGKIAPEKKQPSAPPVEDVARSMHPDLFDRWDELQDDRKRLQETLDGLIKQEGTRSQSPAFRAVMDAFNKNYALIADLAPDVKRAYEVANNVSSLPTGQDDPANVEKARVEAAAKVAAQPSSGFIKHDVTTKLIQAGQPQDIAEDTASVVQTLLETRAAQWQGGLGTADELYRGDFPDIQAGGAPMGLKQYGGQGSRQMFVPDRSFRDNFATAKSMEGLGMASEAIHLATGWFKGLDGRWKFEFGDDRASMKPEWDQVPEYDRRTASKRILSGISVPEATAASGETTLGQILQHDELFKHYPEAADIRVRKETTGLDFWGTTLGSFDNVKNLLRITPGIPDPLSVILHEVQHWIQHREGFSVGGSSEDIVRVLPPEMKESAFQRTIAQLEDDLKELPKAQEKVSKIIQGVDFDAAQKIYQKVQDTWDAADKFDKQLKEEHGIEDPSDLMLTEHPTQEQKTLQALREKFNRAFDDAYKAKQDFENTLMKKYFGTSDYFALDRDNQELFALLTVDLPRDKAKELLLKRQEEAVKNAKNVEDDLQIMKNRQYGQEAADKILQKVMDEEVAHKFYENLSGEIEARDVQARQFFNDTERKVQKPYSSQSFSSEDVILAFDKQNRSASKPVDTGHDILNQRNKKEIFGSIDLANNIIHMMKNGDASTALHEVGHYALDRLRQDAKNPMAPDQIKADAKTVNDWLNSRKGPKGKPLSEEAKHEVWARAWERYFMEGKAPTKELAGVFQRFKAWLTEIYKGMKTLNVKIPDEVRQVMDRLLGSDIEHPIIEEEKPNEPAQATNTQDVSQGTTQAAPAAAGQQSDPNTLTAQQATADKTSENPSPEATVLNQSKFLGPKGEVHIDRISSDADVNQYVKDFYNANEGFEKDRRGHMTDTDMISTADDIATSPRKLKANIAKLQKIYNEDPIPLAVRVEAVRRAIRATAKQIRADARGGVDTDVSFADNSLRLTNLMAVLEGARSDWGRLGHLLGTDTSPEGGPKLSEDEKLGRLLQEKTGRSAEEVREQKLRVQSLDSDQKAAQAQKDWLAQPSIGDKILFMYRNWLISGPLTHMTYALGNTLLILWKAFPESLGEAVAGSYLNYRGEYKLPEGYNGDPTLIKPSYWEPVAAFYALGHGSIKGFIAGWESFKAGQTTKLPGEGAASTPFTSANPFKNHLNLSKNPLTGKAFSQSLGGLVKVEGGTRSFLPTGTLIGAPGERMVAPIHTISRHTGFYVRQDQLIWRKAVNEGLAPFTQAFRNRVAELQKNVPEEIRDMAAKEATEGALMGKPGEWTRNFNKWVNTPVHVPVLGTTKVGAFISPFATISSNIQRLSFIERSPIGLWFKTEKDALSGKLGPNAQTLAYSRQGVTLAFAGAMATLLMEQTMTGAQSSDRNKANAQQMADGLPYSIRIGDFTYQYSRLGVIGQIMATYADFWNAGFGHATWDVAKGAAELDLNQAETGMKEEGQAGIALMAAFSSRLSDEGMLAGISDLMKAKDDPDKYGPSWTRNFITALTVPYSVGVTQMDHLTDPYVRSARDLLSAYEAKIPGLSEDLPARVDVFGNPIPNKGFLGVYFEKVNDDPVLQAFQNTGYFPAPVSRHIMGVPLTEAQYNEYAMKAGQLSHMLATQFVNMPGWDQLTPVERHDMLKQAFTEGRSIAAQQMMAESWNSNIIDDAINLKAGIVNGVPGTPPQQ